MTVTYEFVAASGNLTLDESQLVRHNPVLTHTGKGDLRATFEYTKALEDYAKRQNRVNVKLDGTTKWTGYLLGVNHNERQATTTIRADGIGKRLEETRPDYASIGGNVVYTNISLEDALRDYWPRTPFSNFTVTDQSTEIVTEDTQVQSADTTTEWGNITSLSTSDPFVIQSGNLEVAQTCFTTEGENATTDQGTEVSSGDYSGGTAQAIQADSSSGTPSGNADFIEWDFTPAYDIPADQFGVKFRDSDNGDADGSPEIQWTLEHANGNSYDLTSINTLGAGLVLGWTEGGTSAGYDGTGYTGPDVTGGSTHTLRVDVTNSDGALDQYTYAVDVVAPYDARYSYTFDNTVDANGWLSGPELFPDAADAVTNTVTTSYNIKSATVSSTWNDTSNNQAIAISNDDGSSYVSNSNTSNPTVNFTSAGRSAKTKFTFSRYGSRTTATPTTGFNGQVVQDYTLTADLNDLVVIDRLELSRNHFDNLQTLHDYGDFLWVIEHDDAAIGNLVVSSFQRGDETRPSPPEFENPQNKQPEVKAETYYNSIYVEGALDSNGDRPTAEAKDSTAISNDDREISPGVLRDPTISTEGGAQFRANALLDTALQNNDLVGTITAPPELIHPGYARTVDLGDGDQLKTVEEVSLSQSQGNLQATFDFVVRAGFAEDIAALRRNSKEQSNQI